MSEHDTVTMNVSLPGPLKNYVDGKVNSGIYGSASEFVREAIREKLQREEELKAARDTLERKLLEGVNSGNWIEFDDKYFERKKASLVARFGAKKSKE